MNAPGELVGFVFDPEEPDRIFVVEVVVDGYSIAFASANEPGLWPGGADEGGLHGFSVALPAALAGMLEAPLIELKLANTNQTIHSLRYSLPEDSAASPIRIGDVRWDGGLRLVGRHAARPPGRLGERGLRIYSEGEALDADIREQFLTEDGFRWGVYNFDVTLPTYLADGRPHEIRVLDELGRELDGSPLTVLASSQGIKGLFDVLADPHDGPELVKAWGSYLEQLLPSSLPFRAYDSWRACFMEKHQPSPMLATVVVMFGESEGSPLDHHDSEAVMVVRLTRTTGGAIDQSSWQSLSETLRHFAPELVLFLAAGSRLLPGWRLHLGNACAGQHGARAAYADVEVEKQGGEIMPLLLPAYDATRWLRQAYATHLIAMNREAAFRLAACAPSTMAQLLIELLGAVDDAAQDIAHVPHILARVPPCSLPQQSHELAKAVDDAFGPLGISAEPVLAAESLPTILLKRHFDPLAVDILVPTRDRLDLLEPCVETLLANTKGGAFRLHVVDNGSREEKTRAYLDALVSTERASVIRSPGPFNFSRINNEAVAATTAPLICFLNNDVEVLDGDWLDAMRSLLADQKVGGVGAKLLWPNGMVQHGGVILGTGFAASHAYDTHIATDAGYADGLLVEREATALTAACLMVRRADFLAVGGFDEKAFPVAFNDVDLCLKLRALGRRLVWTPKAVLIHKESRSRGREDTPEKERRARRELEVLRSRWSEILLDDPYYHPCLNLNTHPFSGLAMPPRPQKTRYNSPGVRKR